MKLTLESRSDYNPFETYFVICPKLFMSGFELSFGDAIPDFSDLNHRMAHWHNGVIGNAAELEMCDGEPVKLCWEDPLQPIARFVTPTCVLEDQKIIEVKMEANPSGLDVEKISIVNAGLLNSKDDLIAYAATFGIKLKKATNINLKMMLETLESEAKAKGLIKK